MILVRLAIYAWFLYLLPVSILLDGCSITMKLSALIFANYFLSRYSNCFCLSISIKVRSVSDLFLFVDLSLTGRSGLKFDWRVLYIWGVFLGAIEWGEGGAFCFVYDWFNLIVESFFVRIDGCLICVFYFLKIFDNCCLSSGGMGFTSNNWFFGFC